MLEVVVDALRMGPVRRARQGEHRRAIDLRDLVWSPAPLTFANGGQTMALVPSRYAGGGAADGALQLARKTEWLAVGPQQYRGLGQRMLVTDAAERGLLEVREIVLQPAPAQLG